MISGAQQLPGVFAAEQIDVLHDGAAGDTFKKPEEIEFAEAGVICDLLYREFVLQILFDIADGINNALEGMIFGNGRRSAESVVFAQMQHQNKHIAA